MKSFVCFLLIFVSTNLLAIEITPTLSKSLVCNHGKSHKTVIINQNNKITIWFKNDSNAKKITGIVSYINDSIVFIRKTGSYINTEIPIKYIHAVSKRNNTKLILGSVSFVPLSILSVGIIKLLDRASNNRTTASGVPNRANGMAGVIGIVMGILVFPITIVNGVIVTKQILHKKMQLNNGWTFRAG